AEVLEESQRHGDLLVEDFTDTYHNLTLKTLFLLKWAVRECPPAAFVPKTDERHAHQPRAAVARGCRAGYLPRSMFPEKLFPDYVSGVAYVLTGASLGLLFREAMDTPLLPLEDVFLTGVVAARLDVPRVNISRFWPHKIALKPSEMPDHPCVYHHMLAMHHFSAEKLRQLWKSMLRLQPALECDTFLMHILGHLFTPGSYQVRLTNYYFDQTR
ncbi:Hexosyltransferase, partial [Gryllus bimaculatus]